MKIATWARRVTSMICQWHVIPTERRHMDVSAGEPAMDGTVSET